MLKLTGSCILKKPQFLLKLTTKKKHVNTLPVLNTSTHTQNCLRSNPQRCHLDGTILHISTIKELIILPCKKSCGFRTDSFFPEMKHDLLNFKTRKIKTRKSCSRFVHHYDSQSTFLLWHCPTLQTSTWTA